MGGAEAWSLLVEVLVEVLVVLGPEALDFAGGASAVDLVPSGSVGALPRAGGASGGTAEGLLAGAVDVAPSVLEAGVGGSGRSACV